MKICILTTAPNNYSNRRIIFEAEKRGHKVELVNYLKCYLHVSVDRCTIYYNGQLLEDYDAVIPRVSASYTFFGTAVVRQFEIMKTFCLNSSLGITRSRDKLRALQTLARRGINVPMTGSSHSTADVNGLIETVGGAPLVVKLVEGTQGLGVVLTRTHKAAESVIQAFSGLKTDILVQDFIGEAKGSDIRVFVVGKKVVAAMMRTAAKGDFRSNVHRGGKALKVKLTQEEKRMALRAASEMKLNIAGVDIIRSKTGPMVLEVNSSPGLEGIEGASDVNIAEEILKYIERTSKRGSRDSIREQIKNVET
jgi:ribosomal protein S6--L-glutamate ligase